MTFKVRGALLLIPLALIASAAVLVLRSPDEHRLSCPDPGPTIDTGGPPGPCERINGNSDSFAQDIRPALGGRLAALWITNDTTYNVGIVNPTYADVALVQQRARAYGATGVVVAMKHSGGYLSRIFDAIDPVFAKSNVMCSADVDEPTGKLIVVLKRPDPSVIADLRRIVPADILVLKVDPADCEYQLLPLEGGAPAGSD